MRHLSRPARYVAAAQKHAAKRASNHQCDSAQNSSRTDHRDVVRRHQERNPSDTLFYNPSWRWLGERMPWSAGERPSSLAGTYHEEKWVPSAWRTFDQVLVSAPLVGEKGWVLREADLGIWIDSSVFDFQKSRPRKPFDHLPLLGDVQSLVSGAGR